MILVFVFGLIVGSFLNVLIERLPKGESILGRSRCPNCKTQLSWQDLLPVFSFLFLKGRCRFCQHKIHISYPLVEILTAVIFLFLFKANLGIFWFFISAIFIVLLFSDLKYYILPNKIILSGFLFFIFYFLIFNFFNIRSVCAFHNCDLTSIALGIGFLGGLFLFFYLVSKGRWLGLGDVKLGFLLGAIFGFYWSLNIFYLAVLLGLIAAFFVILFGGSLKTLLPLGAFLSLASLIIIFTRLDFVGILLRF